MLGIRNTVRFIETKNRLSMAWIGSERRKGVLIKCSGGREIDLGENLC